MNRTSNKAVTLTQCCLVSPALLVNLAVRPTTALPQAKKAMAITPKNAHAKKADESFTFIFQPLQIGEIQNEERFSKVIAFLYLASRSISQSNHRPPAAAGRRWYSLYKHLQLSL